MIELSIFLVLLISGGVVGMLTERSHLKSIIARERASRAMPVIASKYPAADQPYDQHLVTGGVVVASDYFKSFTAGLINVFGGAVTPYESLLDRGRREAILRMKDDAKSRNADYVFNVKMETSRISVGKSGAIEVLAYGTALVARNKSQVT